MYDNWIRNVDVRSMKRDEEINKRIDRLEKLITSQGRKEISTEINEILSNKNDLELLKILEKIKE